MSFFNLISTGGLTLAAGLAVSTAAFAASPAPAAPGAAPAAPAGSDRISNPVAEFAGTRWSGRALGIQNTGQFLAAAIVPPAIGALIGLLGYPAAFALVALAPAAATPLIPSARLEQLAR